MGYVHSFGAARIEAEDLRLFHERFAPHLPVRWDAKGEEGSPPASQAHIYALWSRMLWDETKDWPVLARLGQDAMRWYKTAQAGDTLSVRLTYLSKQPVGPDRGILISQHDVLNQHGELVMALMNRTVIARKAPK